MDLPSRGDPAAHDDGVEPYAGALFVAFSPGGIYNVAIDDTTNARWAATVTSTPARSAGGDDDHVRIDAVDDYRIGWMARALGAECTPVDESAGPSGRDGIPAIDLVDEACAMLRTEIESMPAALDELTRRVMRLEIEEAALAKEAADARPDDPSRVRLEEIRKELADLRAEVDAMRAQWEAERNAVRKVQTLREEIERVNRDAEEAERRYDLNRAAELRHGQLPELRRRLEAEEAQLAAKKGKGGGLLREVVTEDEIAQIVARWTGIPVSRLQESEREKLLHLDQILHERIVGQDEAVQLVADAIIRPDRASRILADRSGPSSSSGRPASGRRNWRRHSPPPCSTPRRTWCAST